MRAICKLCKYKDSCSYLKRGKESGCIDVQTSDYGYEEAIENATEWLKRELANPMPDDEYQKWCDEKLNDFRKDMLNENKE